MEEVQVISTCLVGAPTSGLVNGKPNTPISKIEMTPWDLQYILLDTIQKGLLFKKPIENNTAQLLLRSASATCLLRHLKTSLSHTLRFFPPLAGRFSAVENTGDDTVSFFINCNNAGIGFTHAVAPALTVASILDSVHVPPFIHSLFPLNNVRNFEGVMKPLFGVQVTELLDGYFIGCTLNHSLGDANCLWQFFNSWSEISRGFEVISKFPVLNRWFPENSSNINVPIHLPLRLDDEKLFEAVKIQPVKARIFHLSKENKVRLRERANSEMGINSISSLQAYMAHVWRSVTRSRKLDDRDDVTLNVVIGTRSRLNPPLPEEYFGNANHDKKVKTTAGELLENGLGWAALEINKTVGSQNSEEVMKMYKGWAENPILVNKASLFEGRSKLGISSSPRYNVYGNDLGWGKPIGVRSGMAYKRDGKITLFPGVEESSVDIEICVLSETMEALEKDPEFMEAFTS